MSTTKINLFEQVNGYFIGTKSAVEALTGIAEGAVGYATDTDEFGSYDGSSWTWGQGGGSFPNPFALTEDITPAALSADQNDYNPTGLSTADVLRLESSGTPRTLTGLAGGADGRIVIIHNIGSTYNVNLADEDAGSTAGNRFALGGNDVQVGPGQAVILQYDSTLSRWYLTTTQDHTKLANIGNYSHSNIDSHIDNSSVHTSDGWHAYSAVIPTRASADDPTYVLTFAGVNLTGTISVGMKIKWTQNSSVRYGIVTAIAYSTDTTLTLYGGTDYDVDDTASFAISDFYYSMSRAPLGFPMSPSKWTYSVTDSTIQSQASPVAGTWYNIGSISIAVHIGIWRIRGRVFGQHTGAASPSDFFITLSTANNSESNTKMTAAAFAAGTGLTSIQAFQTVFMNGIIEMSSKTTHYVNTKSFTGGGTLYNRNDRVALLVEFECAYI